MATTNPTPRPPDPVPFPGLISEPMAAAPEPVRNLEAANLMVSLASLPPDSLEATLARLAEAFLGQSLLVATPDGSPPVPAGSSLRLIPYTPAAGPSGGQSSAWVLTAADFLNAHDLAQKNGARAILLLGGETQTLSIEALQQLAVAVLPANSEPPVDLAVARYDLGPREGLVNSGILYPVTRALFGARPRFPLAVDLGLSLRMAEKLAAVAQKYVAASQPDALIWPIAEACVAGFTIREIEAGVRILPQPAGLDLNATLTRIAGSLFADVDLKAAFWQRARGVQPAWTGNGLVQGADTPTDVKPMLDSFRLAYTNLHEIWSLVLPPASLLGLKRLTQLPPADFRMPDALWARIVYDFILAYRLRTINRGHLLGALTPLYLAWVASHLLIVDSGVASEKHIATLAAAFESDKAYLVSRWRWPDRFNP